MALVLSVNKQFVFYKRTKFSRVLCNANFSILKKKYFNKYYTMVYKTWNLIKCNLYLKGFNRYRLNNKEYFYYVDTD